uniref:Short-chain dehydrogenase/reductase 3 n=1 Tax=Culicoides sonorensis TaxID=179676 RepID=A0A336LMV0_CULSO
MFSCIINLLDNPWINYSVHVLGILVVSCILCLFAVKTFFSREKSIRGKVALITGGGSGLGAAIALELAKEGCHIAILDINLNAATKTVSNLRKFGINAQAYKVDVMNLEEIENAKVKIESELGKVGILVNNAAMLFARCIETESPEILQKMLNVNILSVIWTTRVFLQTMIQENFGHIVTISSIAALAAAPVGLIYTTSKFAVRGFMESLALDLHHKGHNKSVKTTTVYPTFISTNDEVSHTFEVASNIRLHEMKTPESIAKDVVNAIKTNKETLVIPSINLLLGYFITIPLFIRKFMMSKMIKKGYKWTGFATDTYTKLQ